MPNETPQAVEYAIVQEEGLHPHYLVHHVRMYFNANEIEYDTFAYEDLIPYLPK